MKIAVICRTPIHLFRTIQLKTTLWLEDEVDVFVFDSFPNSDSISKRLENTKLFNTVVYIKESECVVQGFLSHVRSIYQNGRFQKLLSSIKYDELYVYNIRGTFVDIAYNILKKNNKHLTFNMIEDGPSIYHIERIVPKTVKYIYPFLNLKNSQDCIDIWWFSKPDFMDPFGNGKIKALPKVTREDNHFVNTINDVFSYSPNQTLAEADILFMEECYRNDGLMNDDYDKQLFKEIISSFPNRKYMLKLHPRTRENRFEGLCDVLPQDGIPWEVYALNYQMDNKILISLSCATMISSTLLFGDELHSLLLYPIIMNDVIDKARGITYFTDDRQAKINSQIDLYRQKDRFFVAANLDEAKQTLQRWIFELSKR